MSDSVEQQLSLFRYLIQTRSFGDSTLRFLDSLLISKDVKSLVEIRSSLTQLLKSESLSIIHSITAETIHDKLLVLDFFVRAFALVGDLESCLALRYEALVMRELKSATIQLLQVSPLEWLNFVEDAVKNGFHEVSVKACENALRCIGNNNVQKLGRDAIPENLKANAISEITRLRNFALTSITSRSVQVQATEYLDRKTRERQKLDLPYKEKRCLASTSFRNGIKRQNMRKLYERQNLLQVNSEMQVRHPNLS
ncbi:protein DOUBLE-STRAND BREAK FORMATION isoform X2 [Medicago truncatula]|uniref:protein DOUBLE-STRAND BREAK FORMATION isoform X2 n=1 Tax=Medicago truncatula TaxID=3880 RepID=UPI000D2F14AD|nr:protein DOUBLE-STRAND BREAK FORMATION isoform X2 [Medicago truncatula]